MHAASEYALWPLFLMQLTDPTRVRVYASCLYGKMVEAISCRVETDGLKQVCIVVSSVMTVNAFLLDQIQALSRIYRVYVVANVDNSSSLAWQGENVIIVPLAIERKIFPWRDFMALVFLFRLFRQHKFDIVHSVTPKAGLLAMTAASCAGIRARIHTFTGQVWATRSGLSRWLLKSMDRLIASLATSVLVDSASQRNFLIVEKVVKDRKSKVLAKGSISGVDTRRFCPNPCVRKEIRSQLGIPDHAVVFLFLGRLNRDKGVLDLAKAFSHLCDSREDAHCMVVGPDEAGMRGHMQQLCKAHDKLHFVDYSSAPEHYMAAADVFCLPSYREGFGTVIIEAASVGIPAIASRIYGITDAVEDGVTGLLHDAGDVESIVRLMKQFAEDVALREKMGESARNRARRDFSKEMVTSAVVEYYKQLMHSS